MKEIKNCITTILLSFLTFIQGANSQDALMNYIPSIASPSPTPFSFTTYGNIPVEGSDGAFLISVPLFSERYRDVDVVVSLGYKSSGVTIDGLGGIIGTDWILDAGGAVTRVMRGIPDEQAATRWYPSQVNPENSLDYSNILNSAAGLGVDTEQDWFSYNVNGISGKFYLDANLNIVVVGGNDEKVVMEKSGNASSYGELLKFTITDTRGFKYIFGGELKFIEGSMLLRDCFVGPKPTFQSAWFLKEIITPTNARVTFEYQAYSITDVTSVVHNRSYGKTCENNSLSAYKATISDCVYSIINSTQALSKIVFGNNSLTFTYDNLRKDGGGLKLQNIKLLKNTSIVKSVENLYEEVLSTKAIDEPKLQTSSKLKYRYFLKEIRFNGLNNEFGSKYLFEYYDLTQLPPRFSYSRDEFGYFNNRSNYSPYNVKIQEIDESSLTILNQAGGTSFATANNEVNESTVHYGLLRKITYPTAGYTEIVYEANKSKNISSVIKPKYHEMSAKLACNSREAASTFRFISTGEIAKIISTASYDEYLNMPCTNNPDFLHDFQMLTVVDVLSNTVVHSVTRKVGETLETSFETTSGREFEVRYKLTSKFNALYGFLNLSYNSETITQIKDTFGGGSRLKSLNNVSANGKLEQRNFYYNVLANIAQNSSTLYVPYLAQYHEMSRVKVPCNTGMIETNFLRITSSNINQLYNFRNVKVFYSAITESIVTNNGQTNGYIERQYNVVEDNAPFIEFGPMIYGVPYSNISEGMLGKASKEKWYDSSKVLKKENTFEYHLLQEARHKNWVFRKNYDISGYTNPGLEMIGGSYSAVHYFNNYIDWKLKKITSHNYQSGGTITSDVLQEYGGNGHKQITKKTKIVSDGKPTITEFYYAPDLLSSNIQFVSDLVQQNRLMPLKIKKYLGGNFLSEETSGFDKVNNLVLLKSVNKKYGVEENRIDEKVNFNQFDLYGNPQEIKKQEEAITTYLWGYGGQFPIVEIKNATYAEVFTVLGQATINSLISASQTEATMEALIKNAGDKLRNDLPKAMVTSYTYQPLVGMKSKTDARGVTEYYEYDGMQRLKAVIDQFKHVTSSMDYHYRSN